MSTELVSISSQDETTIAEAAGLMAQRRVGSILVLDGDRLAGIFTERDVVRALSQAHDASSHRVVDWMTEKPMTITPETEIPAARALMLEHSFRHLPIVEGERVVGMLSMRDLAGVE